MSILPASLANYSPTSIGDELRTEFDALSKHIINSIATNGRGNEHAIARMYLFGKGVVTSRSDMRINVPFGVEPREFRRQCRDKIKHDVLSPLGLGMTPLAARLYVIHTPTRIIGHIAFDLSSTYMVIGTHLPADIKAPIIAKAAELFDNKIQPIVRRIQIHGDELRASDVLLPHREPVPDINLLYPYFEFTPAELWADFERSKSSVLLLIGPPGVGKSSFILEMLNARGWDRHSYIADREDVLRHPDLTDYIRDVPQGSVVVTEDSDKMVAKRENGNSNMAALLNATSGIIPTDTKIIISTNLPNLRQVDEALLRPGRAYRVLEFKKLTVEQAYAVRQSMELSEVDLSGEKDVTLAEAINWHEVNGVLNRPQHIGFTG